MDIEEQYLSDLETIGEIALELECIDEYNYIVYLFNKRKNTPSRKPKPW